ncbi:MAG TPA: YdeI/OmpD-associated family protein [Luteimonas sp.]|nr:YdeI/OmpD-associated family protein [Luteimonas sp.]HRP73567.1 YdeI/OmpD-associated family protein [Luteimonas sp.]
MRHDNDSIRFQAKLLCPASPKGADWAFLVLPAAASARLPARGMVTVDGTLCGQPFQATLEPDGEGSHWLKVEKELREAAGAEAGDTVVLEIAPVDKEPEPKLPADLRAALRANPAALATWQDITPVARRDWIHWISSGKKAETRVKRTATACDKLACGHRRACCFDRSGRYSRGNMGAPEAAACTNSRSKRSM